MLREISSNTQTSRHAASRSCQQQQPKALSNNQASTSIENYEMHELLRPNTIEEFKQILTDQQRDHQLKPFKASTTDVFCFWADTET